MPSDKPTVHYSAAKLDQEEVEEFVYLTRSGKRVTFPNIADWDADDAERFLVESRDRTDGETLKKWLTEKDQDALREEKLTLKQRANLVRAVMDYYTSAMGDLGEGDASES